MGIRDWYSIIGFYASLMPGTRTRLDDPIPPETDLPRLSLACYLLGVFPPIRKTKGIFSVSWRDLLTDDLVTRLPV